MISARTTLAVGKAVLVPSPEWLDTGDNAWQLATSTFVAMQSLPGVTARSAAEVVIAGPWQ